MSLPRELVEVVCTFYLGINPHSLFNHQSRIARLPTAIGVRVDEQSA